MGKFWMEKVHTCEPATHYNLFTLIYIFAEVNVKKSEPIPSIMFMKTDLKSAQK